MSQDNIYARALTTKTIITGGLSRVTPIREYRGIATGKRNGLAGRNHVLKWNQRGWVTAPADIGRAAEVAVRVLWHEFNTGTYDIAPIRAIPRK